jgi:hypothetical protein
VSNSNGVAKIALLIAGIGNIAVAALRAAAYFGIWMEGANLHPTPRINALTVGLGMAPIPALAWVVYLWSRARPSGLLDIVWSWHCSMHFSCFSLRRLPRGRGRARVYELVFS